MIVVLCPNNPYLLLILYWPAISMRKSENPGISQNAPVNVYIVDFLARNDDGLLSDHAAFYIEALLHQFISESPVTQPGPQTGNRQPGEG